MWGRRRRSWGEFGGDSATSCSDSACVMCDDGGKGARVEESGGGGGGIGWRGRVGRSWGGEETHEEG